MAGRLKGIERKIAALVSAVEDGRYSSSLADRLTALEAERDSLKSRENSEPLPIVRLHPRLGEIYAEKIATLEQALNDPAIRTEAAGILRSLIERVELRPSQEGGRLDAILHGDLARILTLCEAAAGTKKRPEPEGSGRLLSVVAGAGFEPATFRL